MMSQLTGWSIHKNITTTRGKYSDDLLKTLVSLWSKKSNNYVWNY